MNRALQVALAGLTAAVSTTPVLAADLPQSIPAISPLLQQQLFHVLIADGWAGWRSVDSTDDPNDNSHATYGGNLFANLPLGQNFSAQLDVQGEFHDDDNSEASQGALMLGGHLSYRNPEHYLLGVFGGYGRPYADTLANDAGSPPGPWGWVVGGEGQVYLGNLTLYGQAGVANVEVDNDSGPEGFVDGWFVRAVGRHFINDDFYLQAEYSYGSTDCYIDGSCSPSEDAGQFHNWGAKAVFRLPHHTTLPLYGTLEYQGGTYTADEDPDTGTEHAFRIGFRLQLSHDGAKTLLANDRYGATLDMPMLPLRAASWVPGLD